MTHRLPRPSRGRRRGRPTGLGRRIAAAGVVGAALAGGACGADFFTGPQIEATTVEPGPAVYRASGAFVPLAYPASGRATYRIDAEGNAALDLDAAFSTADVPGRAVFLSNTPELEGALRVGPLEPVAGAAHWTFRMPRGAIWRYVLVWSEGYGVAMARAELTPDG